MRKKDSYKSFSDSELVAAVRDGDTGAFDAMFLRWHPQVRKFLAMLLKDAALAEDIAQAVFMKVWLYRERLNPEQSLKNYLFVLSKNSALDVFRSRRYLTDCGETPPEKADSITPEHTAELEETRSTIVRTVEEMPSQRKLIFKMSRYRSMPNESIAKELGLSVRTVEKHLQLALNDIKKNLS